MKAWHFLTEDRILKHGDGRIVKVGKTYECEGHIILCKNGMHGSVKVTDALKYAPGPILCRVEIEECLKKGGDKIAGRKRTALAIENVSKILHLFAIDCAERALAKAKNPDSRSIKALEVKKIWIKGEATDKELKEARAEAEAAAEEAASAAWAEYAAGEAAAAATWVASWAAEAWAAEAAWAASWAAAAAAEAEAAEAAEAATWAKRAKEKEKEKQEEVFLKLIQENCPSLLAYE